MDLYIFSRGDFFVEANGQSHPINKNCVCKITNIEHNNIRFYNDVGTIIINLKKPKSCNYYRVWKLNENLFIELIATSFNNLNQKVSTKNFEVLFYDKAIRILSGNFCHTQPFITEKSYAIETNDFLYILNSANMIVMDLKTECFSNFKVNNFLKKESGFEVLAHNYHAPEYFLHFSFNLKNNSVSIKKLHDNANVSNYASIPHLVFCLCKNEVKKVSEYLGKNIAFDELCSYLKNFDNIINIENKYYLYNNYEIVEVNFIIKDNIVIDVD